MGVAITGCAAGRRAGSTAPATAATGIRDPRVEIAQVTNRLISAMRDRDTAELRSLFLPEAALVSVGRGTLDQSVRIKTLDAFLLAVANRRDSMIVRLRNPTTRVDGYLAIVAASYDAYAGAQYNHCGHDTIHLIRREESWLIAAVTYTVALGPCA